MRWDIQFFKIREKQNINFKKLEMDNLVYILLKRMITICLQYFLEITV